jgi:hypothetical protein
VSRRTRVRAMLVRTSQQVRACGSIHDLADPSRRRCTWPSIPSPWREPFAWRDAEDNAKHWNVRSTRSLLLQSEAWQAAGYGFTAVWSHRHPYIGTALQASVLIESQFSRIFPAHPRSLARRFSRATSPRHAQTARRGPRFCGLRASAFPGLLPQPDALGPHSGKCSSCLGSGAHSRRFAQECPEDNPGKYNQGEKQWHSTPTPLL